MPWITELVAEERDFGQWSSLAIDSDNVLHVSFWDEAGANLMYARRRGGHEWEVSTIESGGEVGEYNALALSPHNEPRVAYFDRTRGTVGYARYSADGGWSISPIRDHLQAHSAGPPCLAMTAGDRARILITTEHAFFHAFEQNVDGIFHFFGGIDGSPFAGSAALTVDSDERWHVVYNDVCPFLDCDEGEVSEWITYATDATTPSRYRPSYFAKTPLVHVRGSAAANRVRQPAIALDSVGIVHIVYADREDGILKYLANAGDWAQQVLYDESHVCGASMFMDSADHMHVAFTAGGGDSFGTRLMYATNAGGGWATETIDASTHIGWLTSIAVDGFGQAHITYYDATNRNLRHAVKILGFVEHVR